MTKRELDQKLSTILERAKKKARKGILRSSDISRFDREHLLRSKKLIPIIKGWYIFCQNNVDDEITDTLAKHYWQFIQQYLNDRFGTEYCLSADSSLALHLDSQVIPKQVNIITSGSSANKIKLPLGGYLLPYPDKDNLPKVRQQINGVQVMPLIIALCRASPRYFENSQESIISALGRVDIDELTNELVKGAHTRAACRLMGAYNHIDKKELIQHIKIEMLELGYRLYPVNPFKQKSSLALKKKKNSKKRKARINENQKKSSEDRQMKLL